MESRNRRRNRRRAEEERGGERGIERRIQGEKKNGVEGTKGGDGEKMPT